VLRNSGVNGFVLNVKKNEEKLVSNRSRMHLLAGVPAGDYTTEETCRNNSSEAERMCYLFQDTGVLLSLILLFLLSRSL